MFHDHIMPVLCSLHWLPVKFRISFKIIILTFKAIYGPAPEYIADLISIRNKSSYHLRSNSRLLLKSPSTRLRKTLGDRAFSSAAPTLWNKLSLDIRKEHNFVIASDKVKIFYAQKLVLFITFSFPLTRNIHAHFIIKVAICIFPLFKKP